MKYNTTNELDHFNFSEAYITAIQKRNGYIQLTLDNVTIMPDNSCNRDIREMRTYGLNLKILDGEVALLVQEGYKVYNPDGKLTGQYEDRQVEPEQYNDVLKMLSDGGSCIYSLKQDDNMYMFAIDGGDERTYMLKIHGTRNMAEWDRFLNK